MAALAELIAENLACRRGARQVFAGLSFRLPPGGALVLSGTNGSGKTSLLRILAGFVAPAAGHLLWGARPVAGGLAGYRGQLHYVGHQDAIKPALTGRETLLFWAALRGFAGSRAAPAIARALSAFALEGIADWPCRWLSAGQRRRLALSRLLATPAPLWLLDEPMSSLDDENRRRLEAIIAAHRADGGRVVLSTHAPIALAGAQILVLDRFPPRSGPMPG